MYDHILLPTDGSAVMSAAIEHAVSLAAHHDATIHALYVANTASLGGISPETGWETITDELHGRGKAATDAVADRAEERGVDVVASVREGSPGREIVRYAEETDCDLVVMGTHGRSGVGRLLLGSVAEKVVRASQVPVTTIRVSQEE